MNQADVDAIREYLAEWEEAGNAQDLDRLMGMITDDIELIPHGERPVRGEAALAVYRSFVDGVDLSMKQENREIEVGGNIGYVTYSAELTLTPTAGGDSAVLKAEGIRIFRRQSDGSWKQAKDMWTVVP